MRIMPIAAAAAFSVMASSGLCRAAPQPVRRGQVDLSSPYIPPARVKQTASEMEVVRLREAKAEEKRARKASRLRQIELAGGFIAMPRRLTPA